MSDDTSNPVTEQKVIGDDDAAGVPVTRDEREKEKAFEGFEENKNKDGVDMSVKVYSPSRVYFDDLAFSVSATNDTGEFDVLPNHHPFISLLNACDIVLRTAKEEKHTITISGGMMHVKNDKIIIFLDI
jgi:hypothetical protein